MLSKPLVLYELGLFQLNLFRVNLNFLHFLVAFTRWCFRVLFVAWVEHIFYSFRLQLRAVSLKNLLEVDDSRLVDLKWYLFLNRFDFNLSVQSRVIFQQRYLFAQTLLSYLGNLVWFFGATSNNLNLTLHPSVDPAHKLECTWFKKRNPESCLSHVWNSAVRYPKKWRLEAECIEGDNMGSRSLVVQAVFVFGGIALELPLNSRAKFYF